MLQCSTVPPNQYKATCLCTLEINWENAPASYAGIVLLWSHFAINNSYCYNLVLKDKTGQMMKCGGHSLQPNQSSSCRSVFTSRTAQQ